MLAIKAESERVEIRGCERKKSRDGKREYLVVYLDTPDNQTGETASIVDWDVSREPIYVKGAVGKVSLLCGDGRGYSKYSSVGFIPDRKEQE